MAAGVAMMRLLIVDDEAIARRRLRRLLQAESDLQLIADAADGWAALRAVAAAAPDAIFLDVQMPELDGIAVARRLPPPRPEVVFVTAFDHYAVQAFEIHAVDYLLKPVARERVAESVARLRERLRHRARPPDSRLSALVDDFAAPRRWLDRVPVRSLGRVDLVDVAAIDWIESANNYVILHAAGQTHILRGTLARLEAELDPSRFQRVHRSTLVAIDRIVRLTSATRGDYGILLRDGTTLSLSRTHRLALERALGRRL
jgi:two-component system LytT family response regulator